MLRYPDDVHCRSTGTSTVKGKKRRHRRGIENLGTLNVSTGAHTIRRTNRRKTIAVLTCTGNFAFFASMMLLFRCRMCVGESDNV